MVAIKLNGEKRETKAETLSALLQELRLHERRVATMVNGAVIRREQRDRQALRDGDAVEVITMVGGG
jgi:thiamine biosynthesis protein ThiS